MDRYKLSNGFISEGGEVIPTLYEINQKLNTLKRELAGTQSKLCDVWVERDKAQAKLAAAEAKIEKAPHDAKCSSLWRCTQCKNNHPWHTRSNHENEYHAWSPVECDCWKSED